MSEVYGRGVLSLLLSTIATYAEVIAQTRHAFYLITTKKNASVVFSITIITKGVAS